MSFYKPVSPFSNEDWKENVVGASPGAQWWAVCLSTQKTRVRSLIQKTPHTAHVPAQLLCLYSWAQEPQLPSPHAAATEARVPQSSYPQHKATTVRGLHPATRGWASTQRSESKARAAVKTQHRQQLRKSFFLKMWCVYTHTHTHTHTHIHNGIITHSKKKKSCHSWQHGWI